MDLKKLLALINSKEDKKKALVQRSQESNSLEEVRSLQADIESIGEEIVELRSLYNALSDNQQDEGWQDPTQSGEEGRSAIPTGGFNPVATFSTQPGVEERGVEDIYGTLEYRQAFRDYVVNGTPIPSKFNEEQRADQMTTVGDLGAVIPTNLMTQAIEKATVEGKIIGRVTQTSYQGGVDIPISEVMPEATWLADEETVSDEQKAKMQAKVSFGYHVLECKISIGLLSATVSLPLFEQTVVNQLKKAMIRAIETAIVKGTGSGQPLGFLNMELPEENKLTMNSTEIGTVKSWAKVEGAIPEAVEDEVIYVMSKTTWENHINGMTDTTGQRIGLGKINEKGQKILNGREVLTLDKLPSFEKANVGDTFAVVINLTQYMLNSNLNMFYKKYFDDNKNKWIHKALTIADGKMAMGKDSKNNMVGAEGLLYIQKGAELSARQLKALEKAQKEMEAQKDIEKEE